MNSQIIGKNIVIKNLLWNASGSIWSGILLLLVTPIYLSKLGFSGYGIIGIWLSLQMLIGLLDFGLSTTITKQFTRVSENGTNLERSLYLKTFETIYFFISVLVFLLFYVAAEKIAYLLFNVPTYGDENIVLIIRLMGLSLALQFPFTLFFGSLNGLQLHKKMNLVQVGSSTLRYSLGLIALMWSPTLSSFFIAQTLASLMILIFLRQIVWNAISVPIGFTPIFKIEFLKKTWKFTVWMGLNSVAAVVLGGIDKIILAKLVLPSQLGQYAIVFTAAGCLQIGIQAFYRVYFPRYSQLFSLKKYKELKIEYFDSCILLAKVIVPVIVVGCFFAPQIFISWIGIDDPILANIFRWLLLGLGLSGIGWLPAGFQQAHGWAKLHVYMMLFALILGSILMIWMVNLYGVIGGVSLWVTHGVVEVTLGLWLMHKVLLKGDLFSWYRQVFMGPLILSLLIATPSFLLFPDEEKGRFFCGFWVFCTLIISLCISTWSELKRAIFHNHS